MEPTPLEHVDVVAVATNFTDVPTVLLFAGLVTVTPAKADAAEKTKMAIETRAHFFIWLLSGLKIYFEPCKFLELKGFTDLQDTLGIVLGHKRA